MKQITLTAEDSGQLKIEVMNVNLIDFLGLLEYAKNQMLNKGVEEEDVMQELPHDTQASE